MWAATIFKVGQKITNSVPGKSRVCVRYVRQLSSEAATVSVSRPTAQRGALQKGPGLRDFLVAGQNIPAHTTTTESVPYLDSLDYNGHGRKVFFEVYGCQMNVNDTEIVWAILKDNGYVKTDTINDANVVLVITCAIREGAEEKVRCRCIFIHQISTLKHCTFCFCS